MNDLMLAMLNGWEIVLALAIVLILFGAKRLPELARGLGQGIREFKRSTREVQDEIEAVVDYDSTSQAPRKISPSTQSEPRNQTPGSAPGANPSASSDAGRA